MENMTIEGIANSLKIIASIITSLTIITPIILNIVKKHVANNVTENLEPIKNGMLSLIRSQIVGKCETYTKQGYLPEYARYCLEELFEQYKALGGNHGVETVVYKCFELPLSKEEE